MSVIGDRILALTKQLFPTGRAWKLSQGGTFESLYQALKISETQTYQDAIAVLNSILPDNDNFTADDATDWERRLGLLTNTSTLLTDRKAAIFRKLTQPGLNPAHEHFHYIQAQLQKANFDVYIYENRFPNYPSGYITETVQTFANLGDHQHGDFQHGDHQHGFDFSDVVINYLDQNLDSIFNTGLNLRSTFFVGGSTPGSYANVPASRKEELRHLLLNLKPVQTVGYLLINYT